MCLKSVAAMAYAKWRKGGEGGARVELLPCRVVGLACEMLCKCESDLDSSKLDTERCAVAEFWDTEELHEDGQWGEPQTCKVPVLAVHRQLALYLVRRLYSLLYSLHFSVAGAVITKSIAEGTGHHDLKLKHMNLQGPFVCSGFISMELKVSQVVSGN